MNKIKRKYLIAISIIALLGFGGVVISQTGIGMTAKELYYLLFDDEQEAERRKNMFDEGFWNYWCIKEKVTTELIPTSPDYSSYISMDFYWDYGIPRFGIPTDHNGKILDTVWYTPSDYSRFDGMINSPKYTDTSITVYWYKTPFIVMIIDVLTGKPIFEEVFNGQPSSMFEGTSGGGTIKFYDSVDVYGNLHNPTDAFTFSDISHPDKKDNNLGTTIDYANLPDRVYMLYLVDKNTKAIADMRTIRKNVQTTRKNL